MDKQFLFSLIWDVIILLVGLFYLLRSFGIIKIGNEATQQRYTTTRFKVISGALCAFILLEIILKFV